MSDPNGKGNRSVHENKNPLSHRFRKGSQLLDLPSILQNILLAPLNLLENYCSNRRLAG